MHCDEHPDERRQCRSVFTWPATGGSGDTVTLVTGQITGDTLPAQLLNVVAPVVAATSRERIRSFMGQEDSVSVTVRLDKKVIRILLRL